MLEEIPDNPLPGRILLGVTGGIAAYKSPDLVRRLRERGAEVQVVMTRNAARFIGAASLQAVSGRPVRNDLWDEQAEAAMGHIELARWAELVLIAPATANIMAQLAAGQAADLLSTLCLATQSPIALAPAMNQQMWSNAATQANLALLVERGMRILGPAEGDQACGETGPGRMLEPLDIAAELASVSRQLAGLRVMVTAGPTREAIDPVRYVSNRSSGKMGFAVAAAAAEAGAHVRLVSGPVALLTPPGVERIDVESAEEMYAAVHDGIAGIDVFIAAAAVSDYRPSVVKQHKIKKSSETYRLEMDRAPDTLRSVAALENAPFTVGFAAETQALEANAGKKLTGKSLDMIAANYVGPGKGMETDDNQLTVLWHGGQKALERAPKPRLARWLVALIAERYHSQRTGDKAVARPLRSAR